MRDVIYQIMSDYPSLVIFLHVLSAAIWIGGMGALWFIANFWSKHPNERRIGSRAALFKKYFIFLSPFIVVLFLTSLLMALGYKDNAVDENGFILDLHNFEIYKYINTKGSIWTIMTMNMIFMGWILSRASCKLCKVQKSMDCMWLLSKYLLPFNIVLGIIEIYLGVYLRNSF